MNFKFVLLLSAILCLSVYANLKFLTDSNINCSEICSAAKTLKNNYCSGDRQNVDAAFAWNNMCMSWHKRPDCWCKEWKYYPNGNKECTFQNQSCDDCPWQVDSVRCD